MPKPGWRVQGIREDLFKKLQTAYEKETKNLEFQPSFTEWLNKRLEDLIK